MVRSFDWLRKIFGKRKLAAAGLRPARKKLRGRGNWYRPWVEALEDRTLLSVVFTPEYGAETVTDHGGYRMQSPPVLLLFWGSWWQHGTGANMASDITNAAKLLFPSTGPSSYLSGLSQYGMDGKANFANAVYVNSDPPDQFSLLDLNSTITSEIDNSTSYFPDPDSVPNPPIYVTLTPPGIRHDLNADGSAADKGYNVPGLDETVAATDAGFGVAGLVGLFATGGGILELGALAGIFADHNVDMREDAWIGCPIDNVVGSVIDKAPALGR